jgi:cyclophilin family peptidyl-prolyl cis-trans isomerase
MPSQNSGTPNRRSILALAVAGAASIACQATPATSSDAASSTTPGQTPLSASATSSPPTQSATSTGGSAVQLQWSAPPAMTIDPNRQYTAIIKTNLGDMTATLDPKVAPMTVNNFVFLANQHFYDNVKFHRVIKGFMVQTGDPTGTGRGGPGYRFPDEPVTQPYTRGTLAMANAGPNTNGSQFFIVQQDAQLPPSYTIFGHLTGGLDVLDKIANVPVAAGAGGERSVPTQDVHINTVEIQEK